MLKMEKAFSNTSLHPNDLKWMNSIYANNLKFSGHKSNHAQEKFKLKIVMNINSRRCNIVPNKNLSRKAADVSHLFFCNY